MEIIVEPERRDTFPAIALSAGYLYSVKGISLNEVVVVLPVDPFVEDHFFEKVKALEALMLETDADLGLMGFHLIIHLPSLVILYLNQHRF